MISWVSKVVDLLVFDHKKCNDNTCTSTAVLIYSGELHWLLAHVGLNIYFQNSFLTLEMAVSQSRLIYWCDWKCQNSHKTYLWWDCFCQLLFPSKEWTLNLFVLFAASTHSHNLCPRCWSCSAIRLLSMVLYLPVFLVCAPVFCPWQFD